MAHHTVFIVNPSSSSGRTKKRFEKLLPDVRAEFADAQILLTTAPLEATELTRSALRAGAKLIVAVGGDGTLNEVVNGFFEQRQNIASEARLAVLMSGTGGDFRRSIGEPKELKKELFQIKNGKTSAIDVGVVRCRQRDGTTKDRYFLNESSIGLSAYAALLAKENPGKQNRFAYVVGALRALYRSSPQTLDVNANGEKKTLPDVSFLTFANAAYFGGAMHIAPGASLTDGLADVVSVRNVSLMMMLRYARRLYCGTHYSLEQVTHFQTPRLEILGSYDLLVEADGEPCGRLPASFEILKGAIQLQGLPEQ
jgi:YegS/Rv2252/BmrU family lipid kinase